MIGHSRSPPLVAATRRATLGNYDCPLTAHTSDAHFWPAVQDQPVVRDGPRPELDLRRGEIAAELLHDLLAGDCNGLMLVLAQRGEPRPAGPREVPRVRAEQLDLEEGLEAEHDLPQMRAEGLRVEAQHEVAQRSPPQRCVRVRCTVVSDRLQREPASGGQPLQARAEETAVGGNPLRTRGPVPGKVLERTEREDRVVRLARVVVVPVLQPDVGPGNRMLAEVAELRPAQRQPGGGGDPVRLGQPAEVPAPATADVEGPPGAGAAQRPGGEEVDLLLL